LKSLIFDDFLPNFEKLAKKLSRRWFDGLSEKARKPAWLCGFWTKKEDTFIR